MQRVSGQQQNTNQMPPQQMRYVHPQAIASQHRRPFIGQMQQIAQQQQQMGRQPTSNFMGGNVNRKKRRFADRVISPEVSSIKKIIIILTF